MDKITKQTRHFFQYVEHNVKKIIGTLVSNLKYDMEAVQL